MQRLCSRIVKSVPGIGLEMCVPGLKFFVRSDGGVLYRGVSGDSACECIERLILESAA